MTIEAVLERIATAIDQIEKNTRVKGERVPGSGRPPADETPEERHARITAQATKDMEKKQAADAARKAAKEAAAAAAKPTEVVASEAPKAPETVAPSEPVKNPFDDEFDEVPATPTAPARVVTIEEVRAALKDLRAKNIAKLGEQAGKDATFEVLRKFGNGAKALPGSGAAKGTEGVLQPEYYGPVLDAVLKA